MLAKILNKTQKIVESIVYFALVIMTIIITYQVFSRSVLGVTPAWIQELSLLLLVWIGFIGIAIGIMENTHIQINFLVELLNKKIQKALHLFHRILALSFGLFMLVEGAIFSQNMSTSYISGLKVPSSTLYYAVPTAGALILIYLIAELLGKWKPNIEEIEGEDE